MWVVETLSPSSLASLINIFLKKTYIRQFREHTAGLKWGSLVQLPSLAHNGGEILTLELPYVKIWH